MSVQHHPTKVEDSSLIRFLPLRILYKIDKKLALEEERNRVESIICLIINKTQVQSLPLINPEENLVLQLATKTL
jgi:hypothetical protein